MAAPRTLKPSPEAPKTAHPGRVGSEPWGPHNLATPVTLTTHSADCAEAGGRGGGQDESTAGLCREGAPSPQKLPPRRQVSPTPLENTLQISSSLGL